MEYRYTPSFTLEAKAVDSDESGIFEGYASTFDNIPDSHGDVIAPGAFAKSLRERVPALLWSHDASQPIGKWLGLRETPEGLRVRGKLSLGVARAREAYELAKDDALGLSIGYVVPPGGKSFDGTNRVLTEIELHEVSLVAMPANTRARITAVKHSGIQIDSPRAVQNALRELGLSNRQVKRFMRGGYSELVKLDDDDMQLEALAEKFAALTQILRIN